MAKSASSAATRVARHGCAHVRDLREALTQSPARATEELGDLLFAIANLARKLDLEPEAALRRASDKFTERFAAVEGDLERRGSSVHAATLEEMEAAWQRVKRAQPRSPAAKPSPSARARSLIRVHGRVKTHE